MSKEGKAHEPAWQKARRDGLSLYPLDPQEVAHQGMSEDPHGTRVFDQTHLLSPYLVLAVVHGDEPPPGIEVEEDIREVVVPRGADVDAPRLAVRGYC